MKAMNTRTNPDPEEPPRRRQKLTDFLPEDAGTSSPGVTPSAGTTAAPKAAAVSRTANIFASSPGSSAPGRELSDIARMVEARNASVQLSWSAFNDALRGTPRETSKALQGRLNEYLKELRQLEANLSERDAVTLKQEKGAEKLREQLRHESTAWAEAVQAPYSRGERGEKRIVSGKARAAFAKTLAGTVDAFGRPLAPPSDDEMRSHGLPPLDLSVSAIKPGYIQRTLKRPLDYTMLVKAAGIAAAALKEKPAGISASAVSCRVMAESGNVRTVAYALANDENGGQYHQLLFRFRKSGEGSKELQKFKTILLWFSPGGDHVIFYVNGYPTCEFHIQVNAQHPGGDHAGLLGSVMLYTEDWFTDSREHEKRKSYRVLLGRSGSPRLYQIWGPAAAGGGIKKDVGTFSARAAVGRIFDYSIVDENGVLAAPEKVKAGVVKNWVTDALAANYQTTSTAILEGEAGAYLRAIALRYGQASPRSFRLLYGSASALRKGMETQAIDEVTAALARGPHLYTLYYPAIYSEEGLMDRTSNENTAVELKAQLDMFAANAVSGSEFTIIDASLFRVGPLKSSIEDFDNYRLNQIFRERVTPEGSAFFVVPPYRYLHDMLAKAGKTAKITVVCPLPKSMLEDESLVAKMSYLTEKEGIIFKPASVGGATASLKMDFEHGSSLVLWNDPDTPDASKFFGMSDGFSEVSKLVIENLGLIRRVVVESTGFYRVVKEKVKVRLTSSLKPEGVETEKNISRTITLPQMIREAAISLLTQKIEAGVSTAVPLATALGIPSELVIAAQAAAGSNDPRAIAEAAIDTVAEAYGTPANTYFKYGHRFEFGEEADTALERKLSGFGETPVRENRNKTREQVASRFFRR